MTFRHGGITLIVIDRSAIQPVCIFESYLFDDLNLRYIRNASVTKFIQSTNAVKFSCTLKTKDLHEETNS